MQADGRTGGQSCQRPAALPTRLMPTRASKQQAEQNTREKTAKKLRRAAQSTSASAAQRGSAGEPSRSRQRALLASLHTRAATSPVLGEPPRAPSSHPSVGAEPSCHATGAAAEVAVAGAVAQLLGVGRPMSLACAPRR